MPVVKANSAITLPTVHVNGTSRQALFTENYMAVLALEEAIAVVAKAAPNARDYYVQSDEAYPRALAEHHLRLQALTIVRDELVQILERLGPG